MAKDECTNIDCDDVDCQEHCEHNDVEAGSGTCLDCGKDCLDDLIARAEAIFEGDR